ncbi:MAG: hypothetical protein V7752_10015 [Halopseudomonas sp.]
MDSLLVYNNKKRRLIKRYLITLLLLLLVFWAHLWSGNPVFYSAISQEPGWAEFKQRYTVSEFGEDGYFVRAVKSGYNLFFHTDRYGWRFTRQSADDAISSCASCHTPEDIAYGFVNADRYDPVLAKRVSFEERVMRCYASPSRLNGFVPTVYDPAIRDLRIFARMVAHKLQLSEGALRAAG